MAHEHKLTAGERQLLEPVFGHTLPYDKIVCKVNRLRIGGKGNSITPRGTAYFAVTVYTADFSMANHGAKWIFIHEMTHVWQHHHGTHVLLSAIGLSFRHLFRYDHAYPYALTAKSHFRQFNIEQQASIVADYWSLKQGGGALRNKNRAATLSDYQRVIAEFQASAVMGPSGSRGKAVDAMYKGNDGVPLPANMG